MGNCTEKNCICHHVVSDTCICREKDRKFKQKTCIIISAILSTIVYCVCTYLFLLFLQKIGENPSNSKSCKRSLVISGEEHEEVGKLELSVQPTKKKSRKRSVVINDEQEEVGKLELLVQPTKKQSSKQSVVVSGDKLEEVGKLALLATPSKKESRKRPVAVSDDEPDEVGKLALVVQPSKKERTKRKKTSINYLSNEIHNAVYNSRKKRIKIAEPIYDSPSSAMKRAEEVRKNLPTEYPSFVKMMLPSHVSRVFWLHLPSRFTEDHLPICDSNIELIDEAGMKFECKYLVHKSGLSGGWRGFSLDHKLREGDVVIFQLIAVTTFKVYIVRNDGQDEFQVALGLLTLDDCKGHEVSEKRDDRAQMVFDSESPSTSSDNIECEVLDGICFSDSAVNFEAIKSFENFRIIVDGLVLDSKFSDANRKKYYELCCSQKSFLHEQLLKGLNCNLVIGIIMETITIADAIKDCASSMSIEDLPIWEQTLKMWEQTLKGSELLGMKVGFLRAKLNLMLGNMGDGLQKCIDEQACAAKKMVGLESKLTKLKSMMEKINFEIEAEVAATATKFQSKLKEIANSPW
ncbi:B3 domain-containing protein Os01g0234100-like [Silene latifolia]|uniref:B3 domain-containing protein Os01g0234100-like n=1 Tax=Silene latifolia TaxID=37657 RepID=UPI003D776345